MTCHNTAAMTRHSGGVHCLKCDVSKYFDSVDHGVLLGLLRRRVRDGRVLWLIEEIVRSHPKGIPIGNLTSQLFANVYLNELDHFVKRALRERCYIRYMDDFLILGLDKKRLHDDKEKVKTFLRDSLKLELHPKKAEVFPVDKEVDFLGYVVRSNRRLLRKSTVKRFLKKRKRYLKLCRRGGVSEEFVRNVHISWRGYARFADSYKLVEKLGLGDYNNLMPDQISSETHLGPVEKDIRRISAEVLRERERPESRSISSRELVRQTVRSYTGQSAAKQAEPVQPAGQVIDDALPEYAESAPPEAKREIEQYLEMAFKDGILKASSEAAKSSPFVLDAFHDALAGKLYEELKKRGIVE